ncbi:GntR family transcriptional regulator [Streptomyces sp. NPDC087425]|uniref:GntR family transcriptional regulator n=1 Tax=unclassified Streptomyces TaxID=2593676 RepID=UPI0037F61FD7
MGANFAPRYHQIEQALRERMTKQRPHDPLPSESALCAEFGVSRMTARAALQGLVTEGLIYRVSGRGTFVAEPPARRRAESLIRFSEEMRRRGRVPSSKLISSEMRKARPDEVHRLEVSKTSDVVAITRVRLADGVPVALERAVFPRDLKGLLELDVTTHSLHESLIELGRHPRRGYSSIEADIAGDLDSQLLDITAGAALLVERRVILDQDDRPVELTETRYVGSRYVLDVAFQVDTSPGK